MHLRLFNPFKTNGTHAILPPGLNNSCDNHKWLTVVEERMYVEFKDSVHADKEVPTYMKYIYAF